MDEQELRDRIADAKRDGHIATELILNSTFVIIKSIQGCAADGNLTDTDYANLTGLIRSGMTAIYFLGFSAGTMQDGGQKGDSDD